MATWRCRGNKSITVSYLNSFDAVVSQARCLKREGDGGTSRLLVERRIGVDIGVVLFRLAAGWGAWEGHAWVNWARWLTRALLSEFLWSLGMSARPVSSLHWELLNNVSLLLPLSDGCHLYNHVYISLNPNSHFTSAELLLPQLY